MSCCQQICFPITPIPPPPIIPPPGLRGPIQGDTSGNPAMPGMVGEFIQRSTTASVTVAATGTLVVTSPLLTLPPGDWDVEAMLNAPVTLNGAQFVLNPTVMGASSNMASQIALPETAIGSILTLTLLSQRTQVLIQTSSLLSFDITFINSTSNPISNVTYVFTVNARRMR